MGAYPHKIHYTLTFSHIYRLQTHSLTPALTHARTHARTHTFSYNPHSHTLVYTHSPHNTLFPYTHAICPLSYISETFRHTKASNSIDMDAMWVACSDYFIINGSLFRNSHTFSLYDTVYYLRIVPLHTSKSPAYLHSLLTSVWKHILLRSCSSDISSTESTLTLKQPLLLLCTNSLDY